MDEVVRGLDPLQRRTQRPRARHVTTHDLGVGTDTPLQVLGPARKATHTLAPRLERVQEPAPDVARRTRQPDQPTHTPRLTNRLPHSAPNFEGVERSAESAQSEAAVGSSTTTGMRLVVFRTYLS